MAPGTRRANRGAYAEHDDFEGLPVRQWRHEWADVAPPVQAEPTRKDDIWSVELRWGMPRDTGLLPSHSQELLRAARSGRLYKRPAPAEEEEPDADPTAEKPDKKEDETLTKGFQVKVWKQITRNTDDSTISHLAKRRKGIVTISSKTVTTQPSGATVTRATVRRTDAAGNPYTQEITLQEGQAIDGEIISTTVVPVAAVSDQVQPTPPRNRRPPPPKKNKKLGGPGRGRKKKILPVPALVPGQEGAANGAAAPKPEGTEGESAVKLEREDSNNPDSEMADNDEEEGDDDGDDGDEGEGEDGDDNAEDQDQEMTDASPSIVQPSADTTMEMTGIESPLASKSQAPSNPLLAPPLNPGLTISSPKVEGSPLKNVILPSPTEPSYNITTPPTATPPQLEDTQPSGAPVVPAPAAVEETSVKPPATESEPVVEMEVTTTDPATFIPPHEQVGDIKSPEPAPETQAEEAKTTSETEQADEPQVPAEEAVPAEEKASEPVVEDVTADTKEPSPIPPISVEAPEEPVEPATEAPPADEAVPVPADEAVPADGAARANEAAPTDAAAEASEPAPAAEEAPVAKSPTPAAVEEGPDLLAGLETALGQEDEAERAKQSSSDTSPQVPETEVKEEAKDEVKEEPKDEVKKETNDEEPMPDALDSPKVSGDTSAGGAGTANAGAA